MRAIRLSALALMLLLAAGPAGAQNLGFLKNGPLANLSGKDEDYLRAALGVALNDTADGETITWANPDTGSGGEIQLLDTHQDFGTTCRTLRVETRAGGYENGGRYRLCKAEDGSWRLAPLRRPPPRD